jgi:hypothetical protein
MAAWIRIGFSIALGVSIWGAVSWALKQPATTVSVSTEFWINFSKLVGSNLQWIFLNLAPWLIVGITAAHRPVLSGTAAAFITSLIDSYLRSGWVPSEYYSTYVISALGLALVFSCYGAAGAALGVVLERANNSFKPNPLRGSA